MTEGGGGFGQIPAGFTYFGQFVDHDLTFDKTTVAFGSNVSAADMIQGRSPALDLDSLYGKGPASPGSAKFYKDDRHLKLGKTEAVGGIAAKQGFDLPRDDKAVIPDKRNDENLAVAQTHLAFERFHNRVVDTALPPGTPANQRFVRAREIVVKHYQWVIRHDYLPRILEPSVVDDVFANGRKVFEKNAVATDVPTMPIEFSVAAFRLGHSMIRREYAWNKEFPDDQGTLDFLFAFSGTSGFLGGGSRLPSNWIADWRRLYDLTETGRNDLKAPAGQFNRARRIDTLLADPLKFLPSGSFGGDFDDEGDVPREPRVPQPHAGQDGQARHGPEGGRPPQGQGREREPARRRRSCATATAAPRSAGLTAAQREQRARRHAAVVLRPARGGAQRRPPEGRGRADRRGDDPPRHGGQPLLDRARPGVDAHARPGRRDVPDERPAPVRLRGEEGPAGAARLAFRRAGQGGGGRRMLAAVGDRGVCGDRVGALSGVPVGSAG